MQKEWIDYLLKIKEYSIRNFEEFVKLNTYMLTPEVSLPAYLGLKREDISQIDEEKIKDALRKLHTINDNCEEVLKNDPFLIDFLVSLGLSYEFLSRLLIYMRERAMLPEDLSLPSSNWYESIESRKQLRTLVASVLCNMLSMKLSEKLIGNDELLRAICLEISSVEKIFSSILDSMQEIRENIYGQMFIHWMYMRSKKGSFKASSGVKYEGILREYLRTHPVIQQVIDHLNFMLGGKYHGKSLDGYVKIGNEGRWLAVFESSYQITTGSGQTSKIDRILDEKRLKAFMNDTIAMSILLDGVGWIARRSDAEKFFTEGVNKYPHVFVFTYHRESLDKLALFLRDLYDFHISMQTP